MTLVYYIYLPACPLEKGNLFGSTQPDNIPSGPASGHERTAERHRILVETLQKVFFYKKIQLIWIYKKGYINMYRLYEPWHVISNNVAF